jgi:spermidine synthase
VVIRIAEDRRYFTFLADSRASYEAVPGDGRVALSRTSERYDLIVLDAFSSGSIPMHLLTREALALYVERLRTGGVLLFHVSNRHVDLVPVLGATASDLGLVAFVSIDGARSDEPWIFPSRWMLIARDSSDLRTLVDADWYRFLATPDAPRWTDDFSSLLQLRRR